MDPGEALPQFPQIASGDFASLEKAVEFLFAVEGTHADGVVDDLSGAIDLQSAVHAPGDARQAEIDPWCEAPVEAQFLLAEVVPQRRRGKIEESQCDGFLDLVGQPAGQKNPGYVGLDQGDRPRCMRVRLRRQECPRQGVARASGRAAQP